MRADARAAEPGKPAGVDEMPGTTGRAGSDADPEDLSIGDLALGELAFSFGDLAFDHVAIAARSFDGILPLLEALAGERATEPARVESQGVEVCFVGDRVELIRPLDEDGGVARFLAARGPGLHHIAYRVTALEERMAELKARGYRFTSEEATVGVKGRRIAFLHPRSAGGVLVELVEG